MQIVRQIVVNVLVGSLRRDIGREDQVDIAEQENYGDEPAGAHGRVPGVDCSGIRGAGGVRVSIVEVEEGEGDEDVDYA